MMDNNFEKKLAQICEFAHTNFVPILRPESSKLLCQTIKEYAPKEILEIGTAIGYSGILMLKNAPKAHLTTFEKDENRLNLAKENFRNFNMTSRVTCVLCDANEEVKNLDKNFDFIFLDGPKSHYIKQLPYLLKHLNLGGVLMADNVLFMGEILGDKYPAHKHRTAIFRLREFLTAIQNDVTLESKLIQIEDGLIIAKKNKIKKI